MQLSLLIPTLECRSAQLSPLVEGLEFQIRNAGRSSEVEILSCRDAGGHSIGHNSEDIDWALRMRDDRALQREEFIDSVLYYYHSRRWWYYQWLLDGTEALRHKLGIRMVNRLRIPDSRTPPAEAASLGRGHGQHARD